MIKGNVIAKSTSKAIKIFNAFINIFMPSYFYIYLAACKLSDRFTKYLLSLHPLSIIAYSFYLSNLMIFF